MCMNLLTYALNIFRIICKKIVKNSDLGEGNWVVGDRERLFMVFLNCMEINALGIQKW